MTTNTRRGISISGNIRQRWDTLRLIGGYKSDTVFIKHLLDVEEGLKKCKQCTDHTDVNFKEDKTRARKQPFKLSSKCLNRKRTTSKHSRVDSIPDTCSDDDQALTSQNDVMPSESSPISVMEADILNESYSPETEPVFPPLIQRKTATINPTFIRPTKRKSAIPYHEGKLKVRVKLEPCGICGKRLSSIASRQAHMEAHGERQPYVCEICGKRTLSAQALKGHQITFHAGDDQNSYKYRCEYCGKTMASKASLRNHRRVHTNEKPFLCHLCGKCLSSNASKKLHINKIHTGENLFKCAHCDKVFVRKDHRDSHQNIHTGINLYQCTLCLKSFALRNVYRKHMKMTHSTEFPYQCEQCDRHFAYKHRLKEHITLIHSEDLPFTCEFCGKGCKTRKRLHQHVRKVHKVFISSKEPLVKVSVIPGTDGSLPQAVIAEVTPAKKESKYQLTEVIPVVTEKNLSIPVI